MSQKLDNVLKQFIMHELLEVWLHELQTTIWT